MNQELCESMDMEEYYRQIELHGQMLTPEPEPQFQPEFYQDPFNNYGQYSEAAFPPYEQYFREASQGPFLQQWNILSPTAAAPHLFPSWVTQNSFAPVEQPMEQIVERPLEQLVEPVARWEPGHARKHPHKDPNAPKRRVGRPRIHPPKDPNVPKRRAGRPKGTLESYKRLANGEKAKLSKEERKKIGARPACCRADAIGGALPLVVSGVVFIAIVIVVVGLGLAWNVVRVRVSFVVGVASESAPEHHEGEEAEEDGDDGWGCWMAHLERPFSFLSEVVLVCCSSHTYSRVGGAYHNSVVDRG